MAKRSAQKLAEGVRLSNDKMKTYRSNRKKMIAQYVGPYYDKGGVGSSVTGPEPLNTFFQVLNLWIPHLVYNTPRAMITATTDPDLAPQAELLALAWNHLAEEINLRETLREIVFNAMVGFGVAKIGITATDQIEINGYLHDVSQPFVDSIDPGDFVIDPDARSREVALFEGNCYRLLHEDVINSGMFNKKLAVNLHPVRADETAADRQSESGYRSAEDGFAKYVELVDLWLPRENAVVTIPSDTEGPQGFLREVEWEGPERGPYEMLGFHPIPGKILPLPPMGPLLDLHIMLNKVARKLGRQADRQKDILLVSDTIPTKESEAITSSSDGDVIRVQDAKAAQAVSYGGANEKGYEHAAWIRSWLSNIGGNTDLLGGIAPQSPTLGQDEMLMANASIRIDDMREEVHHFTKRLGERLLWYLWYAPLGERQLSQDVGGMAVPVQFSAEMLEGDLLDNAFDIQPHSARSDTPRQKMRRLLDVITQVMEPMQQMAASQGMMVDVQELMKIVGDLENIPELERIYKQMPVTPEMEQQIGASGAPSIARSSGSGARGGSAPGLSTAGTDGGGGPGAFG